MPSNLTQDVTEELFNQAYSAYEEGKLETALNLLNQIISKNPDMIEAINNRGLVKSGLDREAEAIEDYTRALQIYPEFEMAFVNRGASYLNIGDLQKAIEDFKKALQLNKNSAYTYFYLGDAYGKLGNVEEAIKYFTEAILSLIHI